MKTHRIEVTVDEGSIRVKPDTLIMTMNDDVQWAGTNARQFSVVFDNAGPFDASELGYARAVTRLKPNSRGHFKYTVVSSDDPALKLDPVIIVEDPPTEEP